MVNFLFKDLAEHSLLVKSEFSWDLFKNDLDAFLRAQYEIKKSGLFTEKEKIEAENKELKRQINAQNEKIAALQKDNDDLSQMYQEADTSAQQVPNLYAKIDALQDNLKKKKNYSMIEFCRPQDLDEKFSDEFKLSILLSLKFYLAKNEGSKSSSFANRPDDVLSALLKPYSADIAEYEKNRDEILNASEMSNWMGKAQKAMSYFGLEKYSKENNHPGFRFKGDDRYSGTGASTISDKKHGKKNECTSLEHAFF